MLATVAALVIVLGLAVSLARYVRRQASDRLTKDLLTRLDALVQQYEARYHALPLVPPFVPPGGPGNGATQPASAPGDHSVESAAVGEGVTEGAKFPLLPITPAPLQSPDETLPPEAELQQTAKANNHAFVAALRVEARRRQGEFGDLPASFYDEGTLHDAWGTPIVFMPAMHAAVGMAMANRPFFLSAGSDRQFRTSEDNLYSYEEAGEGEAR